MNLAELFDQLREWQEDARAEWSRACGCPPRFKCWRYLRAEALAESRALRLLLRAHGRYPITNRGVA